MTSRARAAQETRARIIAAALAEFMAGDLAGTTLESVATRAGVTLQTVLRHFGSKSGLISAAIEHTAQEVAQARAPELARDVPQAIERLLANYEQLGELNWRILCHEQAEPGLRPVLARARAVHRAWLEQVFQAQLPARGAERERRLQLLFGATDFYMWKLWRRDLGHTPEQTRALMVRLVGAVLAQFGAEEAT